MEDRVINGTIIAKNLVKQEPADRPKVKVDWMVPK